MITQSAGFVKSAIGRDEMLQIGPERVAHPGDLIITACPDAILLRLPSAEAGSPLAAGYAQRRIKVGCRQCAVCDQEKVVAHIMKWSQRLKALLSYEEEVRKSNVFFATLTFPPHPEGDSERDGAPTEEMVQTAWHLFLLRLDRWYQSNGVKRSDACNHVAFMEHGGKFGRLHMHLLFCARPGYAHPHNEASAVFLRTEGDVPQYGNGLTKLWSDVLEFYGYERLQNWYMRPMESASQLAGYCVSSYLTKGFAEQETYKVRPARQSPAWPELLDWYRDKRYKLQNRLYRRWVGFKLRLHTITAEELPAVVRRLVKEYTELYLRAVSVEGKRVTRADLPDSQFAHVLMERLSELGNRGGDVRDIRGEEHFGILKNLSLHPVMLVLSDRPVMHPARADYLSVASYYHDGPRGIGPVSEINNPSEHLDARYNLCDASHWWPFDGVGDLRVTETETFQELLGWQNAMQTKLDRVILDCLEEVYPATPMSLVTQGMPAPYDIINEDSVRGVIAGFPAVFPDVHFADGSVIQERDVRLDMSVRLSPPDESIQESLDACSDWSELTRVPGTATEVPGIWPDFRLKRGQVKIIDRISQGKSGLYCLPTGFGKSYCYQASHVPGGITLVVSPLLSLIRDQVRTLNRRQVNATYIAGPECNREEVKDYRLSTLVAREPAILYCSPESLWLRPNKDGRHRFLAECLVEGSLRVSHLVIDEVHCCTMWSSFRKAYRALPESVHAWHHPPEVISGFSASISARILFELRELLGSLAGLPFFGLSVIRDNLHLRRSSHHEFTDFFAGAWDTVKLPALIFAGEIKNTHRFADFLTQQGMSAAAYHAKLPNHERVRIEEAFMDGEVDVLCATIAYGMGIDKSDIRTVIHTQYPETIEDYMQQIGRAGRDGAVSECILLNSPGMVHWSDDAAMASGMHRYYNSPHCLWHHIALAHGQKGYNCGNCDNCRGLSPFHRGLK